MEKGHRAKLYLGAVFFVTAVALAASSRFFTGVPRQRLPELIIFAALIVYFHWFPVDFGGKVSYSLGTTVLLPVIWLTGPSEVMLLAGLGALVDGYVGKKSWDRILFNISQSALSGLAGRLIYERLGHVKAPLFSEHIPAVILGGLGYIFTNILIVTAVVSIREGRSWLGQLGLWGFNGFLVNLASGYVGLVFALFIMEYAFAGLFLFALLLIQLSTLLRLGAQAKGEREKRKELEKKLCLDEMTKVYNFRYLNEWLAFSKDKAVAALFLDIDDFKLFNDRYGHAAGDEALRQLAAAIKKSVREKDEIIRYGGEEFVVLMPNLSKVNAKKVAWRIQNNLKELPCAQKQLPITVSIGIASAPEDTKDRHQLLLFADQALSAAKNAGKNTCRVWGQQRLGRIGINSRGTNTKCSQ